MLQRLSPLIPTKAFRYLAKRLNTHSFANLLTHLNKLASRRRYKQLCSREYQFLNKFLLRCGRKYVWQHRNLPAVILDRYKANLVEVGKVDEFSAISPDAYRLNAIEEYINYILTVEPKYKKLLKMWGLKGYEFGLLFGFKNQQSWHSSYNKYKLVRAAVTLIEKYEAAIAEMKPK